ncbi:MAG TPA: hypothetical protein VMU65_14345 [Candidatus Saccharimonadales bacterium]|nr:hypothetical protein [Candidatus Saccharimonadales bacterium]
MSAGRSLLSISRLSTRTEVVRMLLRVALAAPLLATGLGAASAAQTGPETPLCAAAAGVNHVGIVVEHGNGAVIRRCVSFTTPSITALSVLHDSGIQYSTSGFGGGLGDAVCQIDNEPTQYTSCLPSSGSYWVFFVAGAHAIWTPSAHGASTTTLSDGDDVGFRYDPLAGADPPPASPAGVCPVSTPTPTPTAAPPVSPAPTPRATASPVGTSDTPGPTTSDAAAASDPTKGATPPSSNSAAPTTQAAGGPGPSSPEASPGVVLGTATAAGIGASFNPALLIAVCAIAALIGLLGVQGLRRRRQ